VQYDEKEYYRAVMGVEQGTHKGRPPGPRLVKPPQMSDFQFFEKKRMEELFARENDLNAQRRLLQLAFKEAEPREKKERAAFVKSRREELVSGGTGEAEAEAQAAREWAAKPQESTRLAAEADALVLTAEEENERKALLAAGFSSWAKRDFKTFTAACERHGRNAKEAVVTEIAEVTDKSVSEVGRYFDVFWARYSELTEAPKFMDRIEKGEQKIKRREVLETIIADKVGRYPDPYRSLLLPYGPNKLASMRGYTEEEDRFLVCALNTLGYGCWDALKAEIRRHEAFRFNWFIKSRTPAELARRADALIRMLEKEAVEDGTAAGRELTQAGGVSRGRGGARGGRPRGAPARGRASTGGRGAAASGGKRSRGGSAAASPAPRDEDMDEDDEEMEEAPAPVKRGRSG
jgi:SWI/SNF-related matrix-associated actin-dependent regulator of chromatin subfamily A member 5